MAQLPAWRALASAAEVTMAVDGTPIPTNPDYAGCGCRKVSRSERNEQGVEVKVVELVYGWQCLVSELGRAKGALSVYEKRRHPRWLVRLLGE